MTQPLLQQDAFTFPYDYKFPGQASDEKILFVTRENPILLTVRRVAILLILGIGLMLAFALAGLFSTFLGTALGTLGTLSIITIGIGLALLAWWWTGILWRKSVAMITTKRLVKFIYTTPYNRHVLSLPLDMIVDTGAYTKGVIQAMFQLGTFTARSAASSSGVATDDPDKNRVNKKYFYIENVANTEDIQHYVTKVLDAHKHNREHLATFRPFIPHLKGDARKQFMQQWPEYWS